jgi:hypothetical protein
MMRHHWIWIFLVLVLSALLHPDAAAQTWTNIGPTPMFVNVPPAPSQVAMEQSRFAGRVISIAVDPSDAGHWLIGAATGGIWETRDSGLSWTPKTEDLPHMSIGALAFAPSNPNIIYAGTGEGGFDRDNYTGIGVLKSVDGGSTWVLLGASTFARAAIGALRVHPTDPNTVMAISFRGTGGRYSEQVPSPPPFGVFRSTNGGTTWARTLSGDATSLVVDPTSFNSQYAAIGNANRPAFAPNQPSEDNGLYRSMDGGQTWALITGPWTTMAVTTGLIRLAVAPSNPNVLYATIENPRLPGGSGGLQQGLLGLFRTDNAWAGTPTWIQVPTSSLGPLAYCGRQCSAAHLVVVDPSDPDTVIAGGQDLWRCRSCGLSPIWTNIGMRVHPDHRAVLWHGNRLIDGNDGGVVSTTNAGDSWQEHHGTLTLAQFFSGALHPTNPNFILGGLKDTECVVWTGSSTWRDGGPAFQHTDVTTSLAGTCEGEVALRSTRPETDWMTAANFGEISRTLDGGRTAIVTVAGITEPRAAVTAPVRKCPLNDDVFLTGNNQLWKTIDFFSAAAPSWSANAAPVGGIIRGIAFAESDASCNTYAFGTNTGQIRLTINGGVLWRDIDPGKSLPTRGVNSLAFDPADPNVLYAAFSSFDIGTPGKPGHVFKTVNAQATSPAWTNISPPVDLPFNVLAIDPRNSNSVYAGSDTGLWFSSNGGAGWQRLGPNTGLPNVPIYDLKINPATNRIVAFTYGRGAYSLDSTTVPASGPILTISPASSLLSAATSAGYSQNLMATGGIGPYTWSISSGTLPSGLTLSASGKLSGTPTTAGNFTFTVLATDSVGGIATQTYSLTIVAAATMMRSGVLAQVAAGGGWTTVISLNNTSASAVTASVVIHGDDGAALNLPVTMIQQGNTQSGTASSFAGVINPNATLLITLEDQFAATLPGWIDVLSTGPVAGFAIFRSTDASGKVSEGTSPLQTQFPSRIVAPYDNTAGFATGVALANLSNTAITVNAVISDQNGASLGSQSISLPAAGHMAFYFPDRLAQTAGRQGIVTFQNTAGGGLTAVGLRFSPFGTFTSVPISLAP